MGHRRAQLPEHRSVGERLLRDLEQDLGAVQGRNHSFCDSSSARAREELLDGHHHGGLVTQEPQVVEIKVGRSPAVGRFCIMDWLRMTCEHIVHPRVAESGTRLRALVRWRSQL